MCADGMGGDWAPAALDSFLMLLELRYDGMSDCRKTGYGSLRSVVRPPARPPWPACIFRCRPCRLRELTQMGLYSGIHACSRPVRHLGPFLCASFARPGCAFDRGCAPGIGCEARARTWASSEGLGLQLWVLRGVRAGVGYGSWMEQKGWVVLKQPRTCPSIPMSVSANIRRGRGKRIAGCAERCGRLTAGGLGRCVVGWPE